MAAFRIAVHEIRHQTIESGFAELFGLFGDPLKKLSSGHCDRELPITGIATAQRVLKEGVEPSWPVKAAGF